MQPTHVPAVRYRGREGGRLEGVVAMFATPDAAAEYANEHTIANVVDACNNVIQMAEEQGLILELPKLYNERKDQLAERYGLEVVNLTRTEAIELIGRVGDTEGGNDQQSSAVGPEPDGIPRVVDSGDRGSEGG